MFRRLKIRYYFWQVKRKRMTIDAVAYKLGISKRKVKKGYKNITLYFRIVKVVPEIGFYQLSLLLYLCMHYLFRRMPMYFPMKQMKLPVRPIRLKQVLI